MIICVRLAISVNKTSGTSFVKSPSGSELKPARAEASTYYVRKQAQALLRESHAWRRRVLCINLIYSSCA